MFCQKFGECRILGNVDVLCGLTLEEKRDGCLLCGFILWKYSLGSFNNAIRPYFFPDDWVLIFWLLAWVCDGSVRFLLNSYHPRDESQGTGVLSAGSEPVTSGQIPADCHISSNVLFVVDSEVGGAHSVHGGLEMIRMFKTIQYSSCKNWTYGRAFLPLTYLLNQVINHS